MITLELDLCSSVAMGENFIRFSDSLEKFKNEFSKIVEEIIE